MITYEFETKEFSFREGYTRFQVRDGRLELEAEPDRATLALIEKHGGKLKPVKPTARKATKTKAGS